MISHPSRPVGADLGPAPAGARALAILLLCLLLPLSLLGQPSTSTSPSSSYILQQLDVVSVTVYDEPDLSVSQRIDGEGNIRIPLLGAVRLEGMTLREAESALEQAFIDQRYLRNPDVQIIVQQYEGKFVNVLGQVRAPGRVRMPDESEYMLLVDLISQVGGFTGIAKTDSVRITRKGEDGMEETLVIDVGAIITAREAGKEVERIRVYPGDIVFIPERIF